MTVRAANDTSPPTDFELMLYADGELEGDRLAAVEAWLAADRSARSKLTALRTVSSLVRERALDSAQADGIADSVMGLIAAEAAESVVPAKLTVARRRAPASDTSRGIYLIAAGVLAAAAAVLLYVRPPAQPDKGPVARQSATTATSTPAAEKVDADVEHGVEVAAVDFGARMGAVFYVPSGTSASSTTTVVWLSDDSAGEDQ